MIKKLRLEHKGGFYNYKVNEIKANELCNSFGSLRSYLDEMFTNCPNEYFNYGPRSSRLKFKLNNLILHQIRGHEISDLAKQALKFNKNVFKDKHSQIQIFLLENDNKTIAMEVPIWISSEELNNHIRMFNDKFPLTGHIDILRIEDNKIWIWDYKPNAFQEKYAATQVYFYALMLSIRTNISLDNFRCGYFDSNYVYIFKPELKLLENKSLIKFL